jgi:hypothetical protein
MMKAAKSGNPLAKYLAGKHCERGMYVEQSYTEADGMRNQAIKGM